MPMRMGPAEDAAGTDAGTLWVWHPIIEAASNNVPTIKFQGFKQSLLPLLATGQ